MSRIRIIPVIVLAFVLMAAGILSASAQTPTPTTTTGAVSLSKSNTDSVVAFGQWFLSFPAVVNPGADATGAA